MEIKKIRSKLEWGKNATTFSLILGFGSSTIARYECYDSVPSKAHNRILNLLKYPEVVSEFEKGEEYERWLNEYNKKTKIIDLDEKRKELFKRQVINNTYSINLEKKNSFTLRM